MKCLEWLKVHAWILMVIGIAVWAAIIAFVLFMRGMGLSDRIQAMLVTTLVFITLFYSVQTQRLVKEQRDTLEEEQKRRYAEFGRRRIEEYLNPFLELLRRLRETPSYICGIIKGSSSRNLNGALARYQTYLDEIDNFVVKNLYMADPVLRYGFLKVTRKNMPQQSDLQTEEDINRWQEKTEQEIDELIDAVSREISITCKLIRKTYGFFSRDTEMEESPDDLTVLSKRPPLRR